MRSTSCYMTQLGCRYCGRQCLSFRTSCVVSAATALLVHAKSRRKAWGGRRSRGWSHMFFAGFFWRHLVASEVGLIPSCTLMVGRLPLGCSSAILVLGRVYRWKKPHPLQQSQVCNFCAGNISKSTESWDVTWDIPHINGVVTHFCWATHLAEINLQWFLDCISAEHWRIPSQLEVRKWWTILRRFVSTTFAVIPTNEKFFQLCSEKHLWPSFFYFLSFLSKCHPPKNTSNPKKSQSSPTFIFLGGTPQKKHPATNKKPRIQLSSKFP